MEKNTQNTPRFWFVDFFDLPIPFVLLGLVSVARIFFCLSFRVFAGDFKRQAIVHGFIYIYALLQTQNHAGSCFSTYGTANLRAFVVFFETHFPSLPGAGVLETSTVIGLTHMWVRKLTPFWHPTRPTPGAEIKSTYLKSF